MTRDEWLDFTEQNKKEIQSIRSKPIELWFGVHCVYVDKIDGDIHYVIRKKKERQIKNNHETEDGLVKKRWKFELCNSAMAGSYSLSSTHTNKFLAGKPAIIFQENSKEPWGFVKPKWEVPCDGMLINGSSTMSNGIYAEYYWENDEVTREEWFND